MVYLFIFPKDRVWSGESLHWYNEKCNSSNWYVEIKRKEGGYSYARHEFLHSWLPWATVLYWLGQEKILKVLQILGSVVLCLIRQSGEFPMHSLVLVKESTHSFSHRILPSIGVSSVQSDCTPGLVQLDLKRKSGVANIAVWQAVSKDFPCSIHHFLASKREILVVWEHKCNQGNQDVSWICGSSSFPVTDLHNLFLRLKAKKYSLAPNTGYWLGITSALVGVWASHIRCYEHFSEFSTKTLLK